MILDKFRLDGKVAIVTGSSTGLGQGFCLAMVEAGAKVVAGGNVFILGSLYGSVHAGAGGRKDAAVVAMKLMPERLLICDLSVKVKQSAIKRLFSNVPEIAYIAGNAIKIEQYT